MGLADVDVSVNEEYRKISVVMNDEAVQPHVGMILPALDHVVNLLLRKNNCPSFIIDVNYYRKERERLIMELARAAARKAMLTKEEVSLPPMNAYERRLVHVEISENPELKTESAGIGKERHILIKYLS